MVVTIAFAIGAFVTQLVTVPVMVPRLVTAQAGLTLKLPIRVSHPIVLLA